MEISVKHQAFVVQQALKNNLLNVPERNYTPIIMNKSIRLLVNNTFLSCPDLCGKFFIVIAKKGSSGWGGYSIINTTDRTMHITHG